MKSIILILLTLLFPIVGKSQINYSFTYVSSSCKLIVNLKNTTNEFLFISPKFENSLDATYLDLKFLDENRTIIKQGKVYLFNYSSGALPILIPNATTTYEIPLYCNKYPNARSIEILFHIEAQNKKRETLFEKEICKCYMLEE